MKKNPKKNDAISLILSVLLTSSYIGSPIAQASDAFVSANGQFGQGYFRSRDSECFFITPAHVVKDAWEIFLTTESRKQISADLFTVFPGDIAVLKVNLQIEESCPKSTWGDGEDLSKFLDVFESGYIVTRLEDGSTLKTEVKIQAFDEFSTIKITSINPKVDISKGFSGSPLFIADRAAGMLLSVNDGIGNVTRQDALNNYLALFFGSAETKQVVQQNESTSTNFAIATSPSTQELDVSIKVGDTLTGMVAEKAVAEYKIHLEENSPVELSAPKSSEVKYQVTITDDPDGNALFSFESDWHRGVAFAFTPPKTGVYFLRVTGLRQHGPFEIKVKTLTTNTKLKGQANVVTPGDTLTGMVAEKAVAEYKIHLEENSPVELSAPKSSEVKYQVTITDDPDGNALFSFESDWHRGVAFAFTPPKTGVYFLRVTGLRQHGPFEIKVKTLTTNTKLKGQANVVTPGDTLTGMVAEKAVAEYKIHLEENSPVELSAPKSSEVKYQVTITDDPDGNALFSFESDWHRGVAFAFTPPKTGVYFLRVTGLRQHGPFEIKVKSLF